MIEQKKPCISIVIPIYNAEKYLGDCIDSVLSQSFKDFELILVDDGSKDSSGETCDEYAAKDSRIKVFHKPNGGVSSARNMGLYNARAEWIMFVDSDDILLPHALEYCINHSEGVQMVCAECKAVHEDGITEFPHYRTQTKSEIITSKQMAKEILCYKTLCGPFCKLICKTAIGADRFNESLHKGEDAQFLVSVLIHSDFPVYCSSEIIYKYRILPSSLSHGNKERQIKYIRELLSFLKIREQDNDIIRSGLIPALSYCQCYNYCEIIATQGWVKQMSFEDYDNFCKCYENYRGDIPADSLHISIAKTRFERILIRLTLKYFALSIKKTVKRLFY